MLVLIRLFAMIHSADEVYLGKHGTQVENLSTGKRLLSVCHEDFAIIIAKGRKRHLMSVDA
jgi:hypothetical protein